MRAASISFLIIVGLIYLLKVWHNSIYQINEKNLFIIVKFIHNANFLSQYCRYKYTKLNCRYYYDFFNLLKQFPYNEYDKNNIFLFRNGNFFLWWSILLNLISNVCDLLLLFKIGYKDSYMKHGLILTSVYNIFFVYIITTIATF